MPDRDLVFHVSPVVASWKQEPSLICRFRWWLRELVCLALLISASGAEPVNWLVGRWQLKNEQVEVIAEFTLQGTFRQTTTTAQGGESYSGRFQQVGQILQLKPEGALPALAFSCRLIDPETLELTDATGQGVQMKRLPAAELSRGSNPLAKKADGALAPSGPTETTTNKVALADASGLAREPASASAGRKPASLSLERFWEPNERAYTFLKPAGWTVTGGVFNVNPLQVNGPGNTLAPKNDLSVKKDAAGTVMFRWAPVWFYADLTFAPMAAGFPPGSYYKGMQVKSIPTPKSFLIELLEKTRPQASQLKVIAEDSMREVVDAYVRSNQQVNAGLVQMGLRPNAYDAAALLVEYREGELQFREALVTVIVDTRASTFAWSNERTIMMRAPATEYEAWKPVLDVIRTSDHINPQWRAELEKNIDARARNARETDRYINRVANEILEHRRQTHAEMRHEQWLFISGQNEYKNPFTGEIERDTSYYRHRWVNNRGDIILTDQNDFDPNEKEEYKTREWQRSPVWDRQ
jgi:hypothetical protein